MSCACRPRVLCSQPVAARALALERPASLLWSASWLEMSFARDIADRIVFMDAGVIVEEGKPDQLLFAPRTQRVRAFLKRYNDRYRI